MDMSESVDEPEWEKKRARCFHLTDGCCWACGERIVGSWRLHHRFYIAGRARWQYRDQDLVPVHPDCHRFIHGDRLLFSPPDDECPLSPIGWANHDGTTEYFARGAEPADHWDKFCERNLPWLNRKLITLDDDIPF